MPDCYDGIGMMADRHEAERGVGMLADCHEAERLRGGGGVAWGFCS